MNIHVMVVDDEPIAAQATSIMARRADPDIEVTGLCFSGREAISRADVLHPHIVIMDIQMPGINGLEAMRRIRENSPHTKFIILSAYGEFSYAVEALSLGASDYVLKPVKQANFTLVLGKAIAEISARKVDLDVKLLQQEQIQIAVPMIKKDFIRALAPGAHTDEQLIACASFLGIINATGFIIVLSHRDEAALDPQEWFFDRVMPQFDAIADVWQPGLVVAFVPVQQGIDPEAYMQEVLFCINDSLSRRYERGHDVLAGVGSVTAGALKMKASFAQAMSALKYLKTQKQPPAHCICYEPFMRTSDEDDFLTGTANTDTSAAAMKLNDKANRYIMENYYRELTLVEVAAYVNLSPYYFSRFFKENTGLNFSEQLAQIRIDKAKMLLCQPGSSVKDVAFQVGYNDPNYFSKVFHKMTGIKASDYKVANIAR